MTASTKMRTVAQIVASAAGDTPPLEFICNELTAATNLTELAARLGVSRQSLSSFANGLAPDATERLRQARSNGFQAMMERAQQMLTDLGAEPSREALAVVQAKIELIRFQAERQNRSEFGPASAQVNVQINATSGRSFLEAMRMRKCAPDPVRVALPAPESDVDFTIESDSDTSSERDTTGS